MLLGLPSSEEFFLHPALTFAYEKAKISVIQPSKMILSTDSSVYSTIRVYFYCNGLFCPGMVLLISPTNKRDKERLRQLKLREEEQHRIIRTIKGREEYTDDQDTAICNGCP